MTTAVPTRKTGRRIVKGIEHGLSGYTNHACRCRKCTLANREHSKEYRQTRFAGSPLCAVPKCRRVQSRAYGNSLCYRHAQASVALRAVLGDMNRSRLKRYIRDEEMEVTVLKRYTDDEIRDIIHEYILANYPASLRNYVEEEE